MSRTVLIADDDDDATFLLGAYIERSGFAVRIAGSLREARNTLTDQNVAAVLCDRQLGDGDGLTLFEKGRPSWVTWAVILSGEITSEASLRAAHFDSMHKKPFDADKLVKEVKAKLA